MLGKGNSKLEWGLNFVLMNRIPSGACNQMINRAHLTIVQ